MMAIDFPLCELDYCVRERDGGSISVNTAAAGCSYHRVYAESVHHQLELFTTVLVRN